MLYRGIYQELNPQLSGLCRLWDYTCHWDFPICIVKWLSHNILCLCHGNLRNKNYWDHPLCKLALQGVFSGASKVFVENTILERVAVWYLLIKIVTKGSLKWIQGIFWVLPVISTHCIVSQYVFGGDGFLLSDITCHPHIVAIIDSTTLEW